jgi:endonuclease/exonuclease/phosphatase family metal-dependent hydrolase
MNIITWNIQSCRGCDGRVDPKRIVGVCSDMADFDVLCLQEVARNYPDLPGSSGASLVT